MGPVNSDHMYDTTNVGSVTRILILSVTVFRHLSKIGSFSDQFGIEHIICPILPF